MQFDLEYFDIVVMLYVVNFQIGGYLGLLLGYSMYHLAQTFESYLDKRITKWKCRIDTN